MKRFLRHIALFLPVAAAGYLVLLLLSGGSRLLPTVNYRLGNYGHLFSRVREASQTHDVDVLFLGSSHSYRTFDPRFFEAHGYKAFNLGSSNQTPVQTLPLLQDYLPVLNPRLVVFEVHPDIMSNDGVEGSVDLLSNVPVSGNVSRMALKFRNLKVLNTWMYAFMSDHLLHRLDTYQEPAALEGFEYFPGGFVAPLIDTAYHSEPLPPKKILIQDLQRKALTECLQLLQNRHIPYILVEVPASNALRESYTNHPQFEQEMQTFGPYYYLPPMPGPDSLYYFDSDHLSRAGQEVANRLMLDLISSQL